MLPERSGGRDILLLVIAVLLVYGNAFRGVFQFDDYNVIVNNPQVHSWPAWWQDVQQGIRPLLKLTYTLDWVSGLGIFSFHLTNLLIHIANTVLVWLLSRRILAQHAATSSSHGLLPLLAALIFALHPANTEAVTYICGRSGALMAMFYLLGIWLYSEGRMRQNKIYTQLLVPLCMVLALFSKESAVTFPAALLLWDVFNGSTLKTALRHQWPLWLLLPLSGVFFLWHDGYFAMMQNSLRLNDLSGNLATQLLALVYLLRQWFAPFWLNIDPNLPVLDSFAGLWPHLVILVLCIYLIILNFFKWNCLAFALLWMLLHLLPLYLLLPRLDVANDRQLYLAGWPMALAVVVVLSQWLKPQYFRLAVIGVLFVLAGLTVLRNHEYRSEVALWEATAQSSPEKARVQNNLGYAYMQAGRKAEARAAFENALRLDSQYYRAHYNLKRLEQGDNAE